MASRSLAILLATLLVVLVIVVFITALGEYLFRLKVQRISLGDWV
jgi:hypothetical protein